jgi:hypothetical protein
MFIGLQDFDMDIFLRLDDKNIYIYYSDFETIPQLVNYVPLGSFDDEGKLQLISLNMENRVNTGLDFFLRDGFAKRDEKTNEILILTDSFLNQFGNIPEVIDFFEPYLQLCEKDLPPKWCSKCGDPLIECPEYCKDEYDSCALKIPYTEFLKIKGDPRLTFGKMTTAAELQSPTDIVEIKARVITYDENNIPYTDETVKYFNLNDNTSYINELNPNIEINPNITTEVIKETILNDDYLLIDGIVSGDAKLGDEVILFINSIPSLCQINEDYSIPDDPNSNYEIDYSDIYYLIIIYFNGIYRTNPEIEGEVGIYDTLTDINFELNNYSMILNIKEFFTKEFMYFLKTPPGSLPFANDFGTSIKNVIQTKNNIVQEINVQTEINFFIKAFNDLYGNLVDVRQITIDRKHSDVGADMWVIEVYVNILQERIIYKLEI